MQLISDSILLRLNQMARVDAPFMIVLQGSHENMQAKRILIYGQG